MHRHWTTLAACLFALALAMVALRRDPPLVTEPAAAAPARSTARHDATAQPASSRSRAEIPAARSGGAPSREQTAYDGPLQSRQAPADTTPAALTRVELEQRAEWVERDANHELARLIPLLELTAEQQQRVFQALASTSPNFVPGMLVDGAPLKSPAGNPQQAFLAQLSAAQIAAYLQDSNESSAWWSEYLGNLTTLLDHATPAVGGSSTATTAPASDTTTPATKAAHAVTGAE